MATAPRTDLAGDFPRADPELLARFARLSSSVVSDVMDRRGALDSRIQAVWPGAGLVASAFTVWTRPGDNAFAYPAFDLMRPGDVVVVSGGGAESPALIGEILASEAKARGVAGFVVDGAVRDAAGLAEFEVPVFARAVTPAGPYKDGPFALLEPVAVGGAVVVPGDIVLGDGDGVTVVPLARAEEVLVAAEEKQREEEAKLASVTSRLAERSGSQHDL